MPRWILAAAVGLALAVTPAGWAQAPAKAAPAKKPKKIWTNEDLEELRNRLPLSSFGAAPATAGGEGGAATATGAAAEEKKPDEATLRLERIQKQLATLREELAKVDEQLRSLRAPRASGRTTGQGLAFNEVPGGLTTESQIEVLEARRRSLLRQIEELEDEARRSGYAPGAIR